MAKIDPHMAWTGGRSSPSKRFCAPSLVRAIRFETFGDPSVLNLAEAQAPVVDEKTALVRVMAGSAAESPRVRLQTLRGRLRCA